MNNHVCQQHLLVGIPKINTVGNVYTHLLCMIIPGVPGGKVNILEGNSIGRSKQKGLYLHVSYSKRFECTVANLLIKDITYYF
jgi:hypothetical protein